MRSISESVYQRNLLVITAVKDTAMFTVNDIHRLTKLNRAECSESIRLLLPMEAIQLAAKRNDTRGLLVHHYSIMPNAEALLNSARRSVKKALVEKAAKQDAEQISQKTRDSYFSGYKVVKKANVAGMGSSQIKRLDQLLAGVRS